MQRRGGGGLSALSSTMPEEDQVVTDSVQMIFGCVAQSCISICTEGQKPRNVWIRPAHYRGLPLYHSFLRDCGERATRYATGVCLYLIPCLCVRACVVTPLNTFYWPYLPYDTGQRERRPEASGARCIARASYFNIMSYSFPFSLLSHPSQVQGAA